MRVAIHWMYIPLELVSAPSEWDNNSLKVNTTPTRLMATRMVYRHQGQSFQERIPKYTAAGVNSIETHGEWIRQDWLDLADEMGLGTVIVPRCVGRTNDRQGGSEMHLAEHMVLQDQRSCGISNATPPSLPLH